MQAFKMLVSILLISASASVCWGYSEAAWTLEAAVERFTVLNSHRDRDAMEEFLRQLQNQVTLRSDLYPCLLYTSDAADDLLCVDLGGRRIIKKKQ